VVLTGTVAKNEVKKTPPKIETRVYLRIVDIESGEVVATTCCWGTNQPTTKLLPCAARQLVYLLSQISNK
jgi:hypothetical protein